MLVALSSGEYLQASEGEVVILPFGHQHVMSSVAGSERAVPIAAIMPPPPWGPVAMIRHGGGGARTSVVCGYLQCDDPIFDPLISTLPPLFSVRPPAGPAAAWVTASIQYALDASNGHRPAPQSVALRLPELLFSEVLRLYIENAPDFAQAGWRPYAILWSALP